jgi:hypothetical protein
MFTQDSQPLLYAASSESGSCSESCFGISFADSFFEKACERTAPNAADTLRSSSLGDDALGVPDPDVFD